MKRWYVLEGVIFGACVFVSLALIGSACTPADRATAMRTALDSADKGCRAYLELRREEPSADAGAEGGR